MLTHSQLVHRIKKDAYCTYARMVMDILEIHKPYDGDDGCRCWGCLQFYPCPTVQEVMDGMPKEDPCS